MAPISAGVVYVPRRGRRWSVTRLGAIVGSATALALAGCSGSGETSVRAPSSAVDGPTATTAPASVTSSTSAAGLYDAACAGKITNRSIATVESAALPEISGVAASLANPGVLWVENDSGNPAEAYAMDTSGKVLATYVPPGSTNVDWEDIALGPGASPGTDDLYLGDIGDNALAREKLTIYRIREPHVARDTAPATIPQGPVETITFTYPDGHHNAEAMMLDPVTGDLFIISKETDGSAHIYSAPKARLTDGADVVLDQVGELQRGDSAASGLVSQVTSGDITRDGSVVAVRTYGAVLLYRRQPGESVVTALSRPPCDGNAAVERQGEAVGFAPDGRSFYTLSEGTGVAINQNTIG
jgi:hypothetical protein